MELTEKNFDLEIANGVCLVDFWASWCGPCRMLAPVIEEIEKEFEGRAKVGKVDVDKCEAIANRFGIMSIPTLLFFKDGELVGKSVGVKPKGAIVSEIEKYL